MSDKTVAELMALADKYAEAKAQVAVYGFSDVQKRRTALEQAIRRAVDWGEPVARVVNAPHMHMVGPDDGGYYGIQSVCNERLPDGTPLYARRKEQ